MCCRRSPPVPVGSPHPLSLPASKSAGERLAVSSCRKPPREQIIPCPVPLRKYRDPRGGINYSAQTVGMCLSRLKRDLPVCSGKITEDRWVFLVQAKAPIERPWSFDTRRLLFSSCIAISPSGWTCIHVNRDQLPTASQRNAELVGSQLTE